VLDRIDQDYYDVLIGSRIRALDSYQWPWTADTHSCRKDALDGAYQKKIQWRYYSQRRR